MIRIDEGDGRITLITIGETQYAATMSAGVVMALEDLGMDIDTIFNGGVQRWHGLITLLRLCIEAGAKWEKKKNGREFPTIDEEDLADEIAFSETADLASIVTKLVTAGKRTVEAEPPKN